MLVHTTAQLDSMSEKYPYAVSAMPHLQPEDNTKGREIQIFEREEQQTGTAKMAAEVV